MKQIYSTGTLAAGAGTLHDTPLPGRSLRLPAVRASSTGILPDHLRSSLPAGLYAAPPGRMPESEHPLPVRLALLSTPDGRVLTHEAAGGAQASARSSRRSDLVIHDADDRAHADALP